MSETDICNMALAHLGDQRIDDINGSQPKEVICRTFYDDARRQVLEELNWSFARDRARLSTLATKPAFDWQHEAELPGDCIRVLKVVAGPANQVVKPGQDPVLDLEIDQFEVGPNKIMTNYEYVGIYYVKDQKDTSMFSPLFTAALSRLLAAYIAKNITGDMQIANNQMMIYRQSDLQNASYTDAAQDQSGENNQSMKWLSKTPLVRRHYLGNTGTFKY